MPEAPTPSNVSSLPQVMVSQQPLGTVHIVVNAWSPGQTEVQIQWPQEALWGQPNAKDMQAQFRALVERELADAITALSGPPSK